MADTLPSRVCIESPWRTPDAAKLMHYGDYARAAMHDSLKRGEVPFASHLLYTQPENLGDDWENDSDEARRERGLRAAMAWVSVADIVAVYADLGVTEGMLRAIGTAQAAGIPVEYRYIAADRPDLVSVQQPAPPAPHRARA